MSQTIRGGPAAKAGLLRELIKSVRLSWRLLSDGRVSRGVKVLIPGLALGYMLIPADLLPDFLPVLGQLDDLGVLALGLKLFIGMCPPGIVQQHRDDLDGRSQSRSAEHDSGQVVDGEYRIVE